MSVDKPQPRRRRVTLWATAGLVLLGAGLGLNVGGVRDRLIGRPVAGGVTSLAVLPLKNLSGDPEQDYFVDGMTEALITELGKIRALQVLSYQSVIGYRQTDKSLRQIARELKSDAFLEGAVGRSEGRVRITAKLVQPASELHLWAKSYERDQRDVLGVQGELARDVASQIRAKLTLQEQARLTKSRPVDPEAYEAYLRGRARLHEETPKDRVRAKEYFEKAIEQDPGYARAYASLAELYARGGWPLARDPKGDYWDAIPQAREWAEKALKLDDTLAEAHTALARVLQMEWVWEGAEREFRRAIELNPSHPLARVGYGLHLMAMQRFKEAVVQAQRAQQLDPLSPYVNDRAGVIYFSADRFEKAMAAWRKVSGLHPNYWQPRQSLAEAYVTKGMHKQAIAELQTALALGDREPFVLGVLAHAAARAGQREEALNLVGELKRNEGERGTLPLFPLVWAHAGLGDKEQAFAVLERAYEERRDRLAYLNVDRLLDPLRSDPRFRDLVHRVGLPARPR